MATGGGGGETYAGRVGKGIKKRKKLNILDILLERKDDTITYNLSKDELSKLLFRKMKIEPKNIVKIDTSAFRTIHVELSPNIEPESYADLPAFEIRDGLRSKIYRPHHRKDTLVTVSWLDLETPDEQVSHVFSHFGTLKSNIKWCKMRQENEESEEAKLLNNILSGERQFWIELDRSIPSYASIDGRKVKIFHVGQKRTCARCQKDGEYSPGNANARLCGENGGEKTHVEVVWKELLNSVGYIEWTGEETTAVVTDENPLDDRNVELDTEVPPVDGCTGLVLDNLEEDTTIEDIKVLLEKVCKYETLQLCTLHPTGSLRSKIVKDLDTNLIPSIAKKIDKKSFKGRMIFCKPYVPKSPQKEENPNNKNENLDIENDHSTMKAVIPAPEIPGLPEQDRIKALKLKEKKERKEKKSQKDRKSSKEENLDIKNLSQKDFLLKPKSTNLSIDDEKTNDFQFSDVESEAFEESKEEVEDVDAFATPYTALKSTFARNIALSESRPRSLSISIKRQSTSDDIDENHRKKSLKSNLPTATMKTLKH